VLMSNLQAYKLNFSTLIVQSPNTQTKIPQVE
jgi:hypothetical protein